MEVPTIAEAEQRPALFTRMGFPRPLSATIDHRAVGGVRRARFERGVLFLETVFYSRLSVDSIMRSIQQNILEVVRTRAER